MNPNAEDAGDVAANGLPNEPDVESTESVVLSFLILSLNCSFNLVRPRKIGGNVLDEYYLQYELSDGAGARVVVFEDENDRDGCHISLDMYRANLGPVDDSVLARIAAKFRGKIVQPDSPSASP